MDDILANTLTSNIKKSKTLKEKVEAMALAMIALIDCQKKTSQRVKDLVKKDEEKESWKKGVYWVIGIITAICSALGVYVPLIIEKLCK